MKKQNEDSNLPVDSREVNPERRAFLVGALAAAPAVALIGCGDADALDPDDLAGETSALWAARSRGDCIVSAHERRRRRRLCANHVEQENEHDIDGIMRTFARDTEVSVNGLRVTARDAIRTGHVDGGFSTAPGALVDLRVVPEVEYITDDEIVFEGHLIGTHVAPMNGFPPTSREVAINYVAFYRFDRAGKLVSERLTFNHGVLAPPPPTPPV